MADPITETAMTLGIELMNLPRDSKTLTYTSKAADRLQSDITITKTLHGIINPNDVWTLAAKIADCADSHRNDPRSNVAIREFCTRLLNESKIKTTVTHATTSGKRGRGK